MHNTLQTLQQQLNNGASKHMFILITKNIILQCERGASSKYPLQIAESAIVRGLFDKLHQLKYHFWWRVCCLVWYLFIYIFFCSFTFLYPLQWPYIHSYKHWVGDSITSSYHLSFNCNKAFSQNVPLQTVKQQHKRLLCLIVIQNSINCDYSGGLI